MSDPTISQAHRAFDLLMELWNEPSKIKCVNWQHQVYKICGPSTAPEFSVLPGDLVELLVDGHRGKFKGEIGVVQCFDGRQAGIRVPGKIAPGEIEEYVSPYGREQFKVVRRSGEPK